MYVLTTMSQPKMPAVVTTKDISQNTSYFQSTDYVVGHYNDDGKLDPNLKGGALPGAQDLMRRFAESASKVKGAEFVPTPKQAAPVAEPVKKGKRGRPPKNEVKAAATPIILTPPPAYAPVTGGVALPVENIQTLVKQNRQKMKVTFETDFGQIGMQVQDIYETKLAVGLVFAQQADISFTPKPGQNFRVLIDKADGTPASVFTGFYADITFDLPGGQKLMLLFRANDEVEEEGES